jgi:hypothetical protein
VKKEATMNQYPIEDSEEIPLGKEYEVDFFDWDPTLQFKLKEACSLMCREVVRNIDAGLLPNPPSLNIGSIVGVLAMNEEIELLVKFDDELLQLSKTEFCADYKLVPEW